MCGCQEKQAEEERLARQEIDADYMAPFLALLGNPDIDELTLDQVQKLREMCLLDYKQQLIGRAQLIHDRFEKVWPTSYICPSSELYQQLV